MNRLDTTKGGAPGTGGHRPNASAAATATDTIAASILQGRLQPAHGAPQGVPTREEQRLSHCAGGARPYPVIVPGGAE